MPQRLLRPGITTSKRWNRCSWFGQSFYLRLLTLVDDYGRFEADPELLQSLAFPYGTPDGKQVSVADICEQLQAFVSKELVITYEVSGKSYLQMLNWKERTRSESKYPDAPCGHLPANDGACVQKIASPPQPSSPPSPEREMGDAGIPTLEEVLAEAAMRAVTPETAKNFYDYHEGNNYWLNRHQVLINWRHRLIGWKVNDQSMGGRGAGKGTPTAFTLKTKRDAIQQRIDSSRANPGSASYDNKCTDAQKNALAALRKEYDEITEKLAALPV